MIHPAIFSSFDHDIRIILFIVVGDLLGSLIESMVGTQNYDCEYIENLILNQPKLKHSIQKISNESFQSKKVTTSPSLLCDDGLLDLCAGDEKNKIIQ